MRSWGSPAVTEHNGEEAGEINNDRAGGTSMERNETVQTDLGQSKKKKKRKGDKGGTGVNANSKRPRSVVDEEIPIRSTALTHEPTVAVAVSEPKSKKRKHQSSAGHSALINGDSKSSNGNLESTGGSITAVMSSKQIKRLRKTMSKLENATGGSTPLVDWLQRVCQSNSSEDKALDSVEVMRGLKVSLMDSKWVLDV